MLLAGSHPAVRIAVAGVAAAAASAVAAGWARLGRGRPALWAAVTAWCTFNVFIAAYEFLLFAGRQRLADGGCRRAAGFWTREAHAATGILSTDFWLETWREYACAADGRYMDARSFVHTIETANAVIASLMALAVLLGSSPATTALLLAQALNCALYFATLAQGPVPPCTTSSASVAGGGGRKAVYLGVSMVWLAVPSVLAARLLLAI